MTVTERVDIAPRTGAFARVAAGRLVTIIDVDGGQVADLYAWSATDPDEHMSAQHTRAITDSLFPKVGEDFSTNHRRPILRFEWDDTPGVHDMLIASCDKERYQQLGCEPDHASCSDNFRAAMAESGIGDPGFTPQSVNLFMAIPVDADGGLSWEPAVTRAGDSVTMRALMDCVIVVSACPQDVIPINNLDPTRVAIEVRNA